MNVSRQPFVVSALLAAALGVLCVLGQTAGHVSVGMPPANILDSFATDRPVWATAIGGAIAVLTLGLISQLAIRMAPGASRNYLPIQVFVVAACATGAPSLVGLAAALFTVAGMRRAAMSMHKQMRLESVFRAGLFFGLAALLYPPAAVVAAVMTPATLVIYKRSGREWIAGLVGLWLPFALVSFVHWALGTGPVGELVGSPRELWASVATASGWLAGIPFGSAIVGGSVIAFGAVAVVCGLGMRKGVRTTPRRFMVSVSILFVASLASLAIPGSGPDALPMIGVGAACATPYGFTGRRATVSAVAYFLMVGAVGAVFFLAA